MRFCIVPGIGIFSSLVNEVALSLSLSLSLSLPACARACVCLCVCSSGFNGLVCDCDIPGHSHLFVYKDSSKGSSSKHTQAAILVCGCGIS